MKFLFSVLFFVVFSSSAIADTGKWEEGEDVSKMDDSVTPYISLDAEETLHGNRGGRPPSLIIMCRDNQTEMFVDLGTFVSVSASGATMLARIDSDKPFNVPCSVSTDGEGVFWNKPIPFIKKMIGHKRLLVKVERRVGEDYTVEFDINGIEKIIKHVCEPCSWKP